ncbi:MAG: N-acetylmuramoyl-L-alanine amidase, partial [Planctomycetota bacterium]
IGRLFAARAAAGESRAGAPLDPLTAPPAAFAWTDLPDATFPIPPYAQFLAGVRLVLDPGHVGQRDRGGTWKRGPTGLREPEVNLRVAQFLAEFLTAAGADVTLTRARDEPLNLDDAADLAARAQIANERRADLLLSIHHNAADSPDANYTSIFYHDGPDHSPASACAARHLLAGLNDALRLKSHLSCAVLSDKLVARNGLRLLRECRVPAVLTEASFHSNPAEEQRLRDPLYNRREAYGLFLGLARWAQAGLPRVALAGLEPRARNRTEIVVALNDGLAPRGGWGADQPKIMPDSLVVRLAGQPLSSFELDSARRRLVIRAPRVKNATQLYVDFETILGQHVLHPWLDITAQP